MENHLCPGHLQPIAIPKKTAKRNVHNTEIDLWLKRVIFSMWVSFVLFWFSTSHTIHRVNDTPKLYIQQMTTNIVPSFMNVDMGTNVRSRK